MFIDNQIKVAEVSEKTYKFFCNSWPYIKDLNPNASKNQHLLRNKKLLFYQNPYEFESLENLEAKILELEDLRNLHILFTKPISESRRTLRENRYSYLERYVKGVVASDDFKEKKILIVEYGPVKNGYDSIHIYHNNGKPKAVKLNIKKTNKGKYTFEPEQSSETISLLAISSYAEKKRLLFLNNSKII